MLCAPTIHRQRARRIARGVQRLGTCRDSSIYQRMVDNIQSNRSPTGTDAHIDLVPQYLGPLAHRSPRQRIPPDVDVPSFEGSLPVCSRRDRRARMGARFRCGIRKRSPPTEPFTVLLPPIVDSCLLDTSTFVKVPLLIVDVRTVSRLCGSSHLNVSLPTVRVTSRPVIVTG